MDKITEKDLDILIEALDSWSTSNAAETMLNIMLNTPSARRGEFNRQAFESEKRNVVGEFEQTIKDRNRTAVLLKAKLIMLQMKLAEGKGSVTVEDLIGKP